MSKHFCQCSGQEKSSLPPTTSDVRDTLTKAVTELVCHQRNRYNQRHCLLFVSEFAACVWRILGVEQQLALLMAVVDNLHTAVESCTSNLVWAQQAQQLRERLQVLRTAVLSAEAGAGRSVFFLRLPCQLWCTE